MYDFNNQLSRVFVYNMEHLHLQIYISKIRITFYLRVDNSQREFRGRIYVKFRGKIQKNSEEFFSMEIQRRNSEDKISKGFRGGSQIRNMQDNMRFQKSNSAGIQMRN